MMIRVAAAVLLSLPTIATAQTTADPVPAATATPAAGAKSLLGQVGGLLGGGGALPQVGTIGAGNAAGLLGYCVRNKLLGATGGQTGAAGVLGRLTGQKDVRTLPGYQAGQAGQVQAANGQTLSLDGLRGQVKNQVCNLVLNRARAFL
ncbi:DUF2501 domain-containing protein [Sphingomonas sp. RP10(2022)]|uniref:DUF2501 domain-containing protein n=1 Tax=Sphingomonas liriopis TaxID=2949094 RepID=A0A9X2KQD1_9SPHN|nr:DUF2501 domain-containing protein [Sphingomonas liriopis]MCP3734802.1 DUF2501 domain-containing protein [Sphingomonas liriopis]